MNIGKPMIEKTAKPNCWDCQHFKITHDPRRPYGCSSMGFKTRALPSQEVFRIQGHDCLIFTKKADPAS